MKLHLVTSELELQTFREGVEADGEGLYKAHLRPDISSQDIFTYVITSWVEIGISKGKQVMQQPPVYDKLRRRRILIGIVHHDVLISHQPTEDSLGFFYDLERKPANLRSFDSIHVKI